MTEVSFHLAHFTRHFAAFFVFLLLATGARAQEDGIPRPSSTVEKAPLFWAGGITQIADLEAYQEMGLNVVVVRLTWTTNANGDISAQSLAPQRAFAFAAARRGLKIIYALPAAPEGMPGAFRLSADSDAYNTLWTAWLQDAIRSLKNTPNLIGWMLPDDPRGQNIFDDRGFGRWISQNYANVEVINRQWGAKFESLDDVSMADVAQLSDTWRGNPTLSAGEIASGQSEITRRAAARSDWAWHPAALALAHYKWDAYRALLTMWVGAVRGEDGGRLVLSGRTPDYAQLLALPAGIDIAVPDLAPSVAENDIVTHNPQSIDIARRGGKFGVLPLLSPRVSGDLPATALPVLCSRWIKEAWARGARGAGFDSFENLRQIPGLADAISAEISKLSTPSNAKIWGEAPVNTTAILLAPLADGVRAQVGDSPTGFARGLYGFGDDLVSGEPSGLVWSLRWGTAFGGIDYLSPDDLAETSLDRYATILAPQTLSVPAEATAQLANYVGNGGVLVADLGLGALQSGGGASLLPTDLANLLGVPGGFEIRPLSFNLSGISSHSLLPTWSAQVASRPGVPLTLGDGPNDAAFAGPVGMSLNPNVVASGGTLLAIAPRIPQGGGPLPRIYTAGLTINPVGRGYALFAPFRLWTNWRPGHVGFDTFLGDLTSRGATITQAGGRSLVPSPVTARFGTTLFSEVVNRPGSILLTNHNAPGENAQFSTQMSAVQTASAGDWLWSGAVCALTPEMVSLVGGRPAPIANPSALESRPRAATLYAVTKAGASQALMMRPVAVQNLGGGPITAQIGEESERSFKAIVWPDSATVVSNRGEWQPTTGTGAAVRLTLVTSPDGYPIAPRSRHRLVVVDYSKSTGKNKFATEEKVTVADERGRLVFEFKGAACAVEITPLVAATP